MCDKQEKWLKANVEIQLSHYNLQRHYRIGFPTLKKLITHDSLTDRLPRQWHLFSLIAHKTTRRTLWGLRNNIFLIYRENLFLLLGLGCQRHMPSWTGIARVIASWKSKTKLQHNKFMNPPHFGCIEKTHNPGDNERRYTNDNGHLAYFNPCIEISI